MSELLTRSNLAEEGSTVPEGSVVEWSGEETAETAPQSRRIGEIAVRDALKLPGGTEGANELPGDAEEAEKPPMDPEKVKKVIEGLNQDLSVLTGLASVIDEAKSVESQRGLFLELLGELWRIRNSSISVGPRLPEKGGDGLMKVLEEKAYAPLMRAVREGAHGVQYLQDYLDDSNNDVTNMSQLRGLVVKFIHDMQGAAARIPTNDPTEHKAGVEEMIKKIAEHEETNNQSAA